ncbi:MAG: delta-lactam-biosynthetic de-N-acetylase [Clostridia bacterium]|nr:delta-lactam-biosynthetic de-N-acetylase [Clostridia bacterium]
MNLLNKFFGNFVVISLKKLVLGFVLLILCVAVTVGLCGKVIPDAITTAKMNVDWGLSHAENGSQPVGNRSQAELSKYDAYYLGSPDEKVMYLTFDAGYEAGYTPQILEVLKKHQVPAAFFLVGNYLDTKPELVKQMVAEGHIVANHTTHHPDMSKISNLENFKKELGDLEAKYYEITGQQMPKYYRPPQGKFSEENLKLAKQLGYKTVFWSLAYADWDQNQQPTHEEALKKLLPRTHNGAVILLHSTSKTNAEILDELLTKWKEMGYTFGTLDQLCNF